MNDLTRGPRDLVLLFERMEAPYAVMGGKGRGFFMELAPGRGDGVC